MLLNSLIFIVLALNSVLSIGVLFRKRTAKENQWYAAFVSFLNLWILSNFLENEPSVVGMERLEAFLRLDFFFALLLFYAWFRFCAAFTKHHLAQRRLLNTIVFLISLILGALSLWGTLIIRDVHFVNGVITFKDGPLWPLYAAGLLVPLIAGLTMLFKAKHKAEKKSIERRQINFIFFGFLLSIGNAVLINLFLQTFFQIPLEVSRLGLYGMSFLVLFTGYAVLRHRLLNIPIIATELFILVLGFILLIPLFDFDALVLKPSAYIRDALVFIGALVFGWMLLQNVRKEIALRQEITNLATSLEQANERLKELDRQKTEFLSIASHQLRTPLSIIKGYIELIQDGAYGKITKKAFSILNDMDESNEHLIKLVDEFLNISRIEQNRTKYSFEKGSIHDLIANVYKELHIKSKNKKLELLWAKDDTMKDMVWMDAEKIRHVIYNFVDNAIKYSDEGDVIITATKEDGGVAVRVKDHGLGFNREDEANFFQKFYRGKNVEGVNVNGTGLGIYVCRKFIEAHSGKVWAKSAGLGKGSEFGFWIPYTQKEASS